jgi:putative transposase
MGSRENDYEASFYRRSLPHWHPEGATVFVTWRLFGSLPPKTIERYLLACKLLERNHQKTLEYQETLQLRKSRRLFAFIESVLDRPSEGPLWLKQPKIAGMVQNALLKRYASLYVLWAYVVMPNHVHVLLRPKWRDNDRPIRLAHITQRLKGATAIEANRVLGRRGSKFWQPESFDHWARDEREFHRIVWYIENNPVKAGLVSSSEEWKWSSASERVRRGITELRALT